MVIEVLAADLGAGMGVGVVAPAEDPGVRDVVRQEITKPVDAIARGPSLPAVAVEAVDGDDAARGKLLVGQALGEDTVEMRRPTQP
jgi:hypothetical protein